jgi:hypothetical protein
VLERVQQGPHLQHLHVFSDQATAESIEAVAEDADLVIVSLPNPGIVPALHALPLDSVVAIVSASTSASSLDQLALAMSSAHVPVVSGIYIPSRLKLLAMLPHSGGYLAWLAQHEVAEPAPSRRLRDGEGRTGAAVSVEQA